MKAVEEVYKKKDIILNESLNGPLNESQILNVNYMVIKVIIIFTKVRIGRLLL